MRLRNTGPDPELVDLDPELEVLDLELEVSDLELEVSDPKLNAFISHPESVFTKKIHRSESL
jgi:hypothetical protein